MVVLPDGRAVVSMVPNVYLSHLNDLHNGWYNSVMNRPIQPAQLIPTPAAPVPTPDTYIHNLAAEYGGASVQDAFDKLAQQVAAGKPDNPEDYLNPAADFYNGMFPQYEKELQTAMETGTWPTTTYEEAPTQAPVPQVMAQDNVDLPVGFGLVPGPDVNPNAGSTLRNAAGLSALLYGLKKAADRIFSNSYYFGEGEEIPMLSAGASAGTRGTAKTPALVARAAAQAIPAGGGMGALPSGTTPPALPAGSNSQTINMGGPKAPKSPSSVTRTPTSPTSGGAAVRLPGLNALSLLSTIAPLLSSSYQQLEQQSALSKIINALAAMANVGTEAPADMPYIDLRTGNVMNQVY